MFGYVKVLTGACVLVATAAALSACAGTHRTGIGTQVSAKTISSSRLILGGRVRCTATVTTPIEVGQALGAHFTFRNISNDPVRVSLAPWDVRMVLRARDGTTFDTQALVSPTIPFIPATKLAAGAARTVPGLGALVHVRWPGPLRITPSCGQTKLPVLRVAVAAPGPPTDGRTAVADVVASSGHLLDRCRPQTPGVAVRGEIDAPDGSAPPLDTTCTVTIHREGGFWVAQALVLSPPGLRVRVQDPYEKLPSLTPGRNSEAIAWEFVVTKYGATSVASAEGDASKTADRMANFWQWSGSSWVRGGDGRCGGWGSSGGSFAGPAIDFVSVCHS
jgi:hypothetical protein